MLNILRAGLAATIQDAGRYGWRQYGISPGGVLDHPAMFTANVLVGNDDNHLKNISFNVSAQGIDLSPAYDLLSTGAYHTRALADHRATWPAAPMMIPLHGAASFAEVTRSALLAAGESLGLSRRIGARELQRMTTALPAALADLVQAIESENAQAPNALRARLAGTCHGGAIGR